MTERLRFRRVFLPLLFAVLLPVAAQAEIVLGPIVNPANGHRYYLLSPQFWKSAEAEAVALGGHLVTINNVAENSFIVANFGPYGPYWIGLTDEGHDGTFVWTSGEPVTFTSWWIRSPTDFEPNGTGVDNYVEMHHGVWNDNGNELNFYAVVEVGFIQNGTFNNGLAGWNTFATPSMSYIAVSVTSGVMNFHREPAPAGTSNQATVYQETGVAVPAGRPILARFDLGNSSTVRKRISVLVLNSTFNDLSSCTFWLPPHAPLQTYAIRASTNVAWTNASIYFYAASAGSHGGSYRIDNVTLVEDPVGSPGITECHDPNAPAPPGGSASANLLVNGDFNTGELQPWATFGTITQQISTGVLQMMRATTDPPAGVVLQATGHVVAEDEILSATFNLGNTSAARKRVTVILHDLNFTDLAACTFWIAPNQPLSPYTIRTYATQAWGNATFSIYPPVGADGSVLLDDVSFTRTPGQAINGTDCLDPAYESATEAVKQPARRLAADGHAPAISARGIFTPRIRPLNPISPTVPVVLRIEARLDETTVALVQVSRDGVNWMTVQELTAPASATAIEVDVSAFAHDAIYVRVVFKDS